MRRRRQREVALQVLFQVELGAMPGETAFERTMVMFGLDPATFDFARELVFGVLAHLERLDRVIATVSRDWRLERMANTDRNVIRLALYELFYREDIPANVSINEALELAKAYGTEDSSRFVNGILGKVTEHPDKVPDA